MRRIVRYVAESSAAAGAGRTLPELALYLVGLAILFYVVDVLFMRWQGLALF
jgi:hypothetical protein